MAADGTAGRSGRMRAAVRGTTSLIAALASLGMLAACALPVAAGTKAGGQPLPVVLNLGTVESGDPPYRFFVERFAREVDARSHGGIRIVVHWQANPWGPESEQRLAEQVEAGDIDLALVPDRVLPAFGASALDALHAPFLIDSMALADAVASNGVEATMLADIPLRDSVGLALVPEDLRHPAGYRRSLTTADDFVRLRIRVANAAPESSTLLRALGAIPTTSSAVQEAMRAGRIEAADAGYPWAKDLPVGMVYTANIALFPKFNILVASRGSMDALSADQQGIVRSAADASSDAAAQQRPTELEALTAVCARGDDAVLAASQEIAILAERAAPVIVELRENRLTAASMDTIASLKEMLPAAAVSIPEICGPPTGDSARP